LASAVDLFDRPGDLNSPAYHAAAVTPSDANDLGYVTRGLYVGGAGNVVVIMGDFSSTVTFSGVPAGTMLPIAVSRVKATNTTATNIVAVW
jgi:hypothetical protein